VLNISRYPAFMSMCDKSPDEDELFRRARRGDCAAFGDLVVLHSPRVHARAFMILQNEDDALDVCQETFLRAWKAVARFDGAASLATWLSRIATNAAIDLCRKRKRHMEFHAENPAASPETARMNPGPPASPSEALANREVGDRIRAAFATLSPEHRTVIALKEIEGLSYAEIARTTGSSAGTVMSRLFYARKKLQGLLADLRYET
jgi:RNA polymerase sigma-70 factor, ECF subfamily